MARSPSPPETGSLAAVDPDKQGIPAATLVVYGPVDAAGDAQLLFVERSAAMRFAGGATVFPGGRVDPADIALGAALAPELDRGDAGARVAAIRETLEETGLAIGLHGARDRIAEDWRAELHAGRGFADILAAHDRRLDLARLTPFARWDPRFRDHRAFDTRFYIAELTGRGDGVVADGTENGAAFWASAPQVLGAIAAGTRSAIFPTERNLERLAGLADFAAACADAQAHGAVTITPRIEKSPSGKWLCIPEAAGYPVTRVPVDAVARGLIPRD